MDLRKFNGCRMTLKPNYTLIPVNTLNLDSEGMECFNSIYHELRKSTFNKIKRTPSGGISYKTRFPAWDVRHTGSVVELTIIYHGLYRIQIRSVKQLDDKPKIYGRQAFRKFRDMLREDGINIDDYVIDSGIEVKETIEKPLIKLERESMRDMTFRNVHHIDFHNSYPAGLVNTHPEFGPTIRKLYAKRKKNEIYKAILNLSIGFMQSISGCGARWAHLSRDAIADNNRRMLDIAKRLKDSGRVILAYNTDGIWYVGDVYHGAGEGPDLGQWHNDHINTKWRAKSGGAYEYIEDGKYFPVIRGRTRLDDIKPRSEWSWGDIYKNESVPIKYIFTEEGGMEEMIDEQGI